MSTIDKIQLSGVTYDIGGSGGGNPTVELTQAQYDELVASGTVQSNTYYIITDAQAGDLTQYWTSAQTNSAITAAVSSKASQTDLETVSGQVANKQDTLVSGTNIKTINNQSLLGSGNIDIQGGGGGGKAVSGGTNISVTTGETADTINCTLPISAGTHSTDKGIIVGDSECSSTGKYAIAFGHNADASGNYSFAMGSNSTANGQQSMRFGQGKVAAGEHSIALGYFCETNKPYQISLGCYISPKNKYEVAVGCWNNSVSASTTFGDSGNTLFSVGNGTSTSERHNAFEIRQNGDIYLTKNGQDVKLQDQLGGGGGGGKAVSGGTNISITTGDTADTINCTLPITINNNHSIVIPNNTNNSVIGSYNFVGGRYCNITNYQGGADPDYAFCYGRYNNVYTEAETAFGKFNVSRRDQSVGGTSATTIFTVGNGTSTSARHNAFEIRQNGDIYLNDGTNDVKLQDTITATAANTTALGGLKLVKLTQSEYDALSPNYDSSTLYIIT